MAHEPPFCKAIRAEATAIAPGRDTRTDGAVRTRKGPPSDHYADGKNPGAPGPVHAVDITHDPAHFDAHWHAEQIRQRCEIGVERRVKYLVSHDFAARSDRIASPSLKLTPGAGFGKRWQWRKQSSRTHANHLHISIVYEPWAENSTAPIFTAAPAPPEPARPWPKEWEADVPKASDVVDVLLRPEGPIKLKSDGSIETSGPSWGSYFSIKNQQGERRFVRITTRRDGAAEGYTLWGHDGSFYDFGPDIKY